MRTFDLDDLLIAQAVVAHGGVTQAAQKLHRVPSNISTRIKQLEARLGKPLFMRRGRRLVPTEEGRLFISYAERLLRLADEAESALHTGKVQGTLRIGSLESTAGSRLPQLLSHYNRNNPTVRIELITGTTEALISKLARHEIEAAFVSEPFHAPKVKAEPVFKEELVLITSQHLQSLPNLVTMSTLTLIAFSSGCSYRRLLEQWQTEHGIGVSSVLELASYPAIVACVAAGTGIALVPKSVLAGLHAAQSVRSHELPSHLSSNRTHLIWHENNESLPLKRLRQLLTPLNTDTSTQSQRL